MTSMGTSANGAWTAMGNALKKIDRPLARMEEHGQGEPRRKLGFCEDCCKTGRRSNFGKDYQSGDAGFRLALGFELEGM